MTFRTWPYDQATVGTYSADYQASYINELWGAYPTLYPNYGVRRGFTASVISGLNVRISSGAAMVNQHLVHSDANTDLAISANSSGNARIDLIVARIRTADSPNFGSLAVVTGSPSATPSAPSMVQTGTEWQIPILEVYVPNGAASFNLGSFKDVRKPMSPFEARAEPVGSMKLFTVYSSGSSNEPGSFDGEYECFLYADGRYIGGGNPGLVSSSLARGNPDAWPLFNLLWNTTGNTEFPMVSADASPAARGTSATADWFLNRYLPLPDLRGRVPVGPDSLGGSAANRITGAWADSIGGNAGEENHTLTQAELPAHTHSITVYDGAGGGSNLTPSTGSQVTPHVGATGSIGSGTAHNTVQPSIAIPYVVKFKYPGH